MKVGDLVVLSARGSKLLQNRIGSIHGGYGIVCKVGDGDIFDLRIAWFKKSGEFYRTRFFDRHEVKKKKV
ncbi:MAG: hypothetical protein GOVbin703_189 [Prokaryotic dsDNA virus sp.]|nr:MAG: hypothetical protein GOVbin703_189 [Prokaryotic dsDNA virus sp.]